MPGRGATCLGLLREMWSRVRSVVTMVKFKPSSNTNPWPDPQMTMVQLSHDSNPNAVTVLPSRPSSSHQIFQTVSCIREALNVRPHPGLDKLAALNIVLDHVDAIEG